MGKPKTSKCYGALSEKDPSTSEKDPSTSEKGPSTSEKGPSTSEKDPSTFDKNYIFDLKQEEAAKLQLDDIVTRYARCKEELRIMKEEKSKLQCDQASYIMDAVEYGGDVDLLNYINYLRQEVVDLNLLVTADTERATIFECLKNKLESMDNDQAKAFALEKEDLQKKFDSLLLKFKEISLEKEKCEKTVGELSTQLEIKQQLLNDKKESESKLKNQIQTLQEKWTERSNEKVVELEKQIEGMRQVQADLESRLSLKEAEVFDWEGKWKRISNMGSLSVRQQEEDLCSLLHTQLTSTSRELTNCQQKNNKIQQENNEMKERCLLSENELKLEIIRLKKQLLEANKNIEILKLSPFPTMQANVSMDISGADTVTDTVPQSIVESKKLKDCWRKVLEEVNALRKEKCAILNKLNEFNEDLKEGGYLARIKCLLNDAAEMDQSNYTQKIEQLKKQNYAAEDKNDTVLASNKKLLEMNKDLTKFQEKSRDCSTTALLMVLAREQERNSELRSHPNLQC